MEKSSNLTSSLGKKVTKLPTFLDRKASPFEVHLTPPIEDADLSDVEEEVSSLAVEDEEELEVPERKGAKKAEREFPTKKALLT